MNKFWCILLIPALLRSAVADEGKPKPPDKANEEAVVVPFELLKSGHMAVQVKVNGKGPYRLIFDTGAPITLLNNKVAKETGILKGAKKPLIALFGSMGDVKIKELEVGGRKVEGTVAQVMDHPTVEAMSKAFGGIEGIVGYPFFARFRTTIDYQTKTLTFVPNGFDPPDVMKAMQAAMMATSGEGPLVMAPSAVWGFSTEKKKGDEAAGVTVSKLMEKGPAAEAGLKVGDRLLTLDGRWTDSNADVIHAVAGVKPGTAREFVVQRDGKEVKITIRPIAGQ